ncbi:MAG: hypothetical protein ABIN13_18620 [Mucilaginibacter sp.]
MKAFSVAVLLLLFSIRLLAQDPEFPKEFIMHLKLHSGMVTTFNGNTPDIYTGGIQLVPQYTFVTNLLRGGVIADGFYTDKKFQGAFGPTVSIKLTTLKAEPFGSLGNINLSIDHLWGTGRQRLLGGGINADIGNLIVLGITMHRDYGLHDWWLQSSLGFRISKKTKIKPI